MKTRQIHGLGLGEFLIFAPAKEMLKSAYFFSALPSAGGFFYATARGVGASAAVDMPPCNIFLQPHFGGSCACHRCHGVGGPTPC